MDLIRNALNAVQKNLAPLVFYMVIVAVTSLVFYGVGAAVVKNDAGSPQADWAGYEIVLSVFIVLAAAFAQSVVFSRMGKDIDRPLWKISGDLEALKRFFPMWTGWNAIVYGVNTLAVHAFTAFGPTAGINVLFIAGAIAAAVYIPVGACQMFLGTAEWGRLPEALKPLYRQFPKTLAVVMFSGLVFFLHMLLMLTTQDKWLLLPLLDFAFAYFDCVIFAAAWMLCMYDRQNPEEVDFDF